jgi:alpha-galactosidase
MKQYRVSNGYYDLLVGGSRAFTCAPAGSDFKLPIGWPSFEINGVDTAAAPEDMELQDRRDLNGRIEEIRLTGSFGEGFRLSVILRVCKDTPVVRFRYELASKKPAKLTKRGGENLTYLTCGAAADKLTEVRFSTYDSVGHAYTLTEFDAFAHEDRIMGPILAGVSGDNAFFAAYEHGSTYPDKYLAFSRMEPETGPEGGPESGPKSCARGFKLAAVKGNYWSGYPLDEKPYETIWFQFGAVNGGIDDLAEAYRNFQLYYCTLNSASRKPYVFYNTWAFQERNKFYNKQNYLTSMNQARMEQEIEIAHRMGVDVFVIDTGWFEKTGDWNIDRNKFPAGMAHISRMLEERGMKLGLWFSCAAAVTSEILKRHEADVACLGGKKPSPHPVWETEESYEMCPVSDYWKDFADRLIYLARTAGVRYFKWDAMSMYGCDDPGHLHGSAEASPEERRDNFSFLMGVYMSKIADRVCEAVPDAIVDMDITECDRYVGLGFLSSGKFFAVNNGPYYPCFDISVPPEQWSNIFVNPGPARTWICRRPLCYDKWIPSVLMMTHYLPDDPESSQLVNLASLMLGQNGIWGDLPGVSEEGVNFMSSVLSVYKQVRDDVTAAYPVVYGKPGEVFEVHEKINRDNGRGIVCLFANLGGKYTYNVSSPVLGKPLVIGSGSVAATKNGARIDAEFRFPGAVIVFFI